MKKIFDILCGCTGASAFVILVAAVVGVAIGVFAGCIYVAFQLMICLF